MVPASAEQPLTTTDLVVATSSGSPFADSFGCHRVFRSGCEPPVYSRPDCEAVVPGRGTGI